MPMRIHVDNVAVNYLTRGLPCAIRTVANRRALL